MVLDTSAILAVLFDEALASRIEAAVREDPVRLLSAASFLEASMVVEARLGPAGGRELDLLLPEAGIEIAAFTAEQAEVVCDAWRRFGRGRHLARLSLGDCFAYALARTSGEPLLFVGEDFSRTDFIPVLN